MSEETKQAAAAVCKAIQQLGDECGIATGYICDAVWKLAEEASKPPPIPTPDPGTGGTTCACPGGGNGYVSNPMLCKACAKPRVPPDTTKVKP